MKNKYVLKFTVVALTIGFFSPSVTVQHSTHSEDGYSVSISVLNTAEARQRARSVNRNRNVNRNVNRNRNRNVNRNVNVHHSGGRYYGGGSYHNNNNGAAVVAGIMVGAVIASEASK